jgi:CheY-like chemotaxis protein
MDQPGRIEVQVEVRKLARTRRFSHGELTAGQYVRIIVSDTGRGMDHLTLGRIFEPFFTTRLAGNGLGLATVREIIREHGGALDVWSRPGAGSRFEVWLPGLSRHSSPQGEIAPMMLRGHGQIVMVVESDRDHLLRDEEILAALNYEPVGFAAAEDALAAYQTAPDRFDAVIIGPLTPENSSLELAAALHAALPSLPLLLATVSTREIGAEKLLAAGVSEIVGLGWSLGRRLSLFQH